MFEPGGAPGTDRTPSSTTTSTTSASLREPRGRGRTWQVLDNQALTRKGNWGVVSARRRSGVVRVFRRSPDQWAAGYGDARRLEDPRLRAPFVAGRPRAHPSAGQIRWPRARPMATRSKCWPARGGLRRSRRSQGLRHQVCRARTAWRMERSTPEGSPRRTGRWPPANSSTVRDRGSRCGSSRGARLGRATARTGGCLRRRPWTSTP